MYWRHQRVWWKMWEEEKKMAEIAHFSERTNLVWTNCVLASFSPKATMNCCCHAESVGSDSLYQSQNCPAFHQNWITQWVFPFPPLFLFSQYTFSINRPVNHLMLTCFLINFYFFNYKINNHTTSQRGKYSNPNLTWNSQGKTFVVMWFSQVKIS